MRQLIQDLLAYSRVGTRGKKFAPVDCNAIVDQAIHQLRVAIAESNAKITHDPLPTLIADQTNSGGLAPKFYLWGLAAGEFIRRQVSFWF